MIHVNEMHADGLTIPVLTARHEVEDSRRWKKSCPIGNDGESIPIDLKVIEPYKKVISHAGYSHHYNSVQLSRTNPRNSISTSAGPAIITFSACYLPERSRRDYNYVMDHLFMWVLFFLSSSWSRDDVIFFFCTETQIHGQVCVDDAARTDCRWLHPYLLPQSFRIWTIITEFFSICCLQQHANLFLVEEMLSHDRS